MKFMIETSARHIHLTQETVEKLFGAGYQLTKRKDLSYPGQFACNERVTLVGPKKEMANVSILGPVRKADQVEVSGSDARALGIDAPVRESGHVEGSGACKLIGPAGEVELKEGVIIAKRHLHVLEADAEKMGIKNGEIIRVACGGNGRKLIFDDVVVRVNTDGATTMHIDTAEAQPAGAPRAGAVFLVLFLLLNKNGRPLHLGRTFLYTTPSTPQLVTIEQIPGVLLRRRLGDVDPLSRDGMDQC